ncbi:MULTISPECIES: D-glycero-beta-D-manno-heptose-7-phosphate kinase [unclassified Nitratiruptor]|uniref:D-glycero-beta-D-manno-heptose-7-phosphate kinase n=1 Tax=unclassified Nitratiruptor TaxID=2624044 RepID=UPI00191536B1|nr:MULTISPECIES: D-glycero-beta-D-manno-heptose-7-phosphate kinase [unclassified Nitratiruptor]BCD60749.1 D-beta-D-heptose 7-phosphate kinase / D-beta-D-heptose 1-phosphate adenosyltransferase [Nitratiruptor sp. YY08-10]BCD64681.1 D-beta-D-heptose 7-phosphate kinase / D-beta-D-heptose 1-phosphate adenosyltransferase [Nitratiruptor sp. YY08-14]
MKPKILVIGDVMIDHYLFGTCERISPEAPVQVVDVQKEELVLGGAGNVVNNLLAFGAEVGILSVVGEDANGTWLEQRFQEKGVQTYLLKENRPTTKKSRIIASNQQIVRVDREEKKEIESQTQQKILNVFNRVIKEYDLVLLSDYDKGVLTKEVTQAVIQRSSVPVFVDPKNDFEKYRGATLIKPNKKEASKAVGFLIKNEEDLVRAGWKLKKELDLQSLIITLSEEGMAIFEEQMMRIATVAKEVYDVTGAGDTVLAALGYAVAKGKNLKEAAAFANLAAGVVVGKVGAATATIEEIEEYERSIHKAPIEEFIKNFEEIESISKDLHKRGKRIVFTNGCFDILHLGHVQYLQKAKELGDVLIVGVNSDASVKRLKGDDRPINPEFDRAYLLASLEAVDYVVIFEEDTPYELIKRIEPDILVKGGDYRGKEVVGSDIAKEVRLIDFVEGKSTTAIVERMKSC